MISQDPQGNAQSKTAKEGSHSTADMEGGLLPLQHLRQQPGHVGIPHQEPRHLESLGCHLTLPLQHLGHVPSQGSVSLSAK